MKLVWKWIFALVILLAVLGCLETDQGPGWNPVLWTSSTSQTAIEILDCIFVIENGIIVVNLDAVLLDIDRFEDPALINYFQGYIERKGTNCFQQPILWLTGLNISKLTGLEQLESSNLKELHLENNQILEVSGLSTLLNLQRLILYGNQLSNVDELSNLSNLDWLDLSYNQISEVSELSNLRNLQWLDLSFNQISDISGFSDLSNLESLYLDGNPDIDCGSINDFKSRMPSCQIDKPIHCD